MPLADLIKQRSKLPEPRLQPREKSRIRLRAFQQSRQAARISDLEVSGIFFPQQSDITCYAGSDDRRASDNRFGDDVGPAFQEGRMDSQLAAHQNPAHAPMRMLTQPAVTRIDRHLAPRALGHLFVHRAADVDDLKAR